MTNDLFNLIGGVVAGSGIILALFWLLAGHLPPRSRRRRRCPKCRYDLTYTSGRRCSECGHEAKRESKLFKVRRRWGWTTAGVVLAGAGYVTAASPRIEERGIVGAVPTTVLIVSAPWLRPNLDVFSAKLRIFLPVQPPSPPAQTWRDELVLELTEHRLDRDVDVWSWQTAMLATVCDLTTETADSELIEWDEAREQLLGSIRWADDRSLTWIDWPDFYRDIQSSFQTRRIWPKGVPVYASVRSRIIDDSGKEYRVNYHLTATPLTDDLRAFNRPQIFRGCANGMPPKIWSDDLVCLGTPDSSRQPLRYRFDYLDREFAEEFLIARRKRFDRQEVDVPIEVDGRAESILNMRESTEFEDQLTDQLRPTLLKDVFHHPDWRFGQSDVEFAVSLGFDHYALRDLLRLIDGTTLAYTLEVLDGTRVIGRGVAWHARQPTEDDIVLTSPPRPVHIDIVDEDALTAANAAGTLALRLRGDATVALRNFQCDQYWKGEVQVPLALNLAGNGW